jgi:DNA primase
MLTPQDQVYQSSPPQTPSRPERRGVSRRTVITEAKERVATIELADLLCGPGKMRKVGATWVARCPIPGHEDHSPSFTVYPETNSWFCFGACLAGGDVVDLARRAWGYEKSEVAMAAAQLLHEFSHDIPPRPESWYAKQERQKPMRAGIEHVRREILLRRLFKWCVLPMVDAIKDEEERRQELERAWVDFREVLLP